MDASPAITVSTEESARLLRLATHLSVSVALVADYCQGVRLVGD